MSILLWINESMSSLEEIVAKVYWYAFSFITVVFAMDFPFHVHMFFEIECLFHTRILWNLLHPCSFLHFTSLYTMLWFILNRCSWMLNMSVYTCVSVVIKYNNWILVHYFDRPILTSFLHFLALDDRGNIIQKFLKDVILYGAGSDLNCEGSLDVSRNFVISRCVCVYILN